MPADTAVSSIIQSDAPVNSVGVQLVKLTGLGSATPGGRQQAGVYALGDSGDGIPLLRMVDPDEVLEALMPNPTFTSVTTGALSSTGTTLRSVQNGITAFATGGQASATPLTKDINRVTTVATADDSVRLPVAVPGMSITVINASAASMDVFPTTGAAIDGGTANAALAVAAGGVVTFHCAVALQWNAVISA